MTKQEQLYQDIFIELSSQKGYTVTKYNQSHIIVGFQSRNFVFKIKGSSDILPWNGEFETISSFEDALRIILLECLPF